MPERNDPLFSPPNSGERKPEQASSPVDNDPLAELARIVSGRGPDDPAPEPAAPTPKPAPATTQPTDKPAGGDILGDLEAELLNDLQASFTEVSKSIQPETPAPAPVTAAPPEIAQTPAPTPSAPPLQNPVSPSAPPAPEPDLELPRALAGGPAQPAPETPASVSPRRWPPPMDDLTAEMSGPTDPLPTPEPPTTQPPPASAPAARRSSGVPSFEELLGNSDLFGDIASTPEQPAPEPPAPVPPAPRAPAAQAQPEPTARQPQPTAETPQSPERPAPQPQSPETPPPAPGNTKSAFGSPRVDISSLPLRRSTAAPTEVQPQSPPPAAPSGAQPARSRWDAPPRSADAPDISRFAPPSAGKPAADAPPAADASEPPVAAPVPPRPAGARPASETRAMGAARPPIAARPGGKAPLAPKPPQPARAEAAPGQPKDPLAGLAPQPPGPTPGGPGGPPPPLDEFAAADGYDDDLPSFETDDIEGLVGRKRPGIGIIAIAAAIVIVLIGGASFFIFGIGSNAGGEPPIIAADATPTKIPPPEGEVTNDDQNKLIYDRVDSGEPSLDSILLKPGSEPLADQPPNPTDNAIARVILPDGNGVTEPIQDVVDDLASTADEILEPVGPRRVRTVVVRPDGTIVSSGTDANGANGAGPETTPAPSEPPPLPNDDIAAITGPNGGLGPNNELAITPLDPAEPADPFQPAPAPPVQPAPEPRTVTPQQVSPQPVAPPAPQPAPRQVPTVQATPDGPIDLTPGNPPAQTAPAPVTQPQQTTPSGGMLVQISSQRSEEAARATFRDLQARYPGILGGLNIDIQRANVGDRGIFYRVRVGPFTASDAQRLCNDLKAAGGDCILARG